MARAQRDPERTRPIPDGGPSPAAGTPAAVSAAVSAPGLLSLSDPRMMRALAHPARLAIWQHLGLDGPATATECAAVAGLSPSACSYHLRTLARYGFVAEDPSHSADGRERPWRAKVTGINVPSGAGSAALRDAGRLLSATAHASAEELLDSYRDREAEYPADWQEALGANYDVLHVTPEELNALRQRLIDLFGEYRRLSRDERPPGARRVHVAVHLTPWFEPDA